MIKYSTWSIRLSFLISTLFFLGLTYFSNAGAGSYAADCPIDKPESHGSYRFVDSNHYKNLQWCYDSVCKMVENGEMKRNEANKLMSAMVFRLAACRGARINFNFKMDLKKKITKMDTFVLAIEQFCLNTYDSNEWADMNIHQLIPQKKWLSTECFCLLSHEVAYPSDFWMILLEPDLPSIKRFREQTDSLCQQLRNGDITLGEAQYRYKLVEIEFKKRLPPEMMGNMPPFLKKPLEALIDIFK